MLRKTLGLWVILAITSASQSHAGDWGSWLRLPSKQSVATYPAVPGEVGPGMPGHVVGGGGCATCGGAAGALGHGPKIGGYVDESPLYPELAPWIFQKSHCRQLFCTGGCGGGHSRRKWGTGEIPTFAPLPYSHQAQGVHAAPPAGGTSQIGFPVN